MNDDDNYYPGQPSDAEMAQMADDILTEYVRLADFRNETLTRLTGDGRFKITEGSAAVYLSDGGHLELQDTITGYWVGIHS
jgi:hypothetical protein